MDVVELLDDTGFPAALLDHDDGYGRAVLGDVILLPYNPAALLNLLVLSGVRDVQECKLALLRGLGFVDAVAEHVEVFSIL